MAQDQRGGSPPRPPRHLDRLMAAPPPRVVPQSIEDEYEVVEHKIGPSKLKQRSGIVTGARVILLFTIGKVRVASSAQVATELGMEEGYIRRVLSSLVSAGILRARRVNQTGTPGVRVFRLMEPDPQEVKSARQINRNNNKIDK